VGSNNNLAGINQFSKARDEGLQPGDEGYPKAENQFTAGTRVEHPESVRAQIQAGVAVRYLQSLVGDSEQDTVHRVAASKILLDKTVASLSSVDQTVRDERELDDPSAVEARLRMLIAKAEPALLSRILGERARNAGDMPILAQPEVGEQPDPDVPEQRNIG
jgi:hypothetical protein